MLSANRYRIACYGFVDKNSGSLASGNFLVMEELLKRGYLVDFYAIKGFVEPQEFYAYPNYRYITFSEREMQTLPLKILSTGWQILENLPKKGGILYRVWAVLHAHICAERVARLAQANHKNRPYDFSFFLGLPGCFRLQGVPSLSWLQGPFYTEGQTIRNLKKEVIQFSSVWNYLTLRVFYMVRDRISPSDIARSDHFICGSQWAKEQMITANIPRDRISVLPYPIDLNLFKPAERATSSDRINLLWLGRIVPRKRLDLALEAIRLLVQEGFPVHLQIIGGFAYSKKYQELIETFEYPDAIAYSPFVDRTQVPELMGNIDILLQPSEAENFGSAVAEALCYGIPVIVGPTNGTKDFINPSSFVFEEYSAESLKETIKRAASAVKTSKIQIAREARSVAEQNFDVVNVVDQLEEIFDKFHQVRKTRRELHQAIPASQGNE